jgi:hypothetical protein
LLPPDLCRYYLCDTFNAGAGVGNLSIAFTFGSGDKGNKMFQPVD